MSCLCCGSFIDLILYLHSLLVLSGRVAELSTALGRAGMRIEAVESINRQLGAWYTDT